MVTQNQAKRLYKYVFSECLKQSSEMDGSRSSDDKAFQAAGPDVENARGPNVDVSVSQGTEVTEWPRLVALNTAIG